MDWSEREQAVLTQLAVEKGISEEAVLRQALRMYQLVDKYLSEGQDMAFRQRNGWGIETWTFPFRGAGLFDKP